MEDNLYPTEKELNDIVNWDYKNTESLLALLRGMWWHSHDGFIRKGNRLELHTYGWSGNEEIIEALSRSTFWMLFWEKTVRGGHYYFKLKQIKETAIPPAKGGILANKL